MSPQVRRRRATLHARPLRRRISQLRRWARHHPRRAAAAAGAACVASVSLWCSYLAWSVASDLDDVANRGEVFTAALQRGDVTGAKDALARFQEAADSARSHTSGPTWWVLERLPLLGDDASAVALTAAALDGIGAEGMPPLVDAAHELTGESFQPTDKVFPLDTIAALEAPARRSEAAFETAGVDLATVDPAGLAGPLRQRFVVLRDLVERSRSTLGSVYRAARLMPSMLGAEGPRDYLMVFQNNAELRSTGGLPGSVSLIHAEDGRVEIVAQEAAANFGRADEPVLPLSNAERRLFGDVLGTLFLNANLTPDVARAAELMAARWQEETGGAVDGVILVDPVAVAYLLTGVGPVEVPGFAPVTAADVVTSVENSIYLSTTDRQVHEDYQNAVARAVFDAFADGRGDSVAAVRGLVTGVGEGRIRLHFFGDDQDEIADTAIAGEFSPTGSLEPEVGVYLNDSTESKMSFYLRQSVSLAAPQCVGGVQDLTGRVVLTNDTPPDVDDLPVTVTGFGDPGRGVLRGQQYVVVYLTAPPGGRLRSLTLDGRRFATPAITDYRGREVATVAVTLDPEESSTIEFEMSGRRGQIGDPRLVVTPGSAPGSESVVLPTPCRDPSMSE